MSPGWTVEDQDALSRFISYLVAALSAEVYIGVQSLHTSSGDFVLVGESGFEFGLVAFRLWELLFQSRPFEVVLGGGWFLGLCVAPGYQLAQRCIIDQGGCRVAGGYGRVASFDSGVPGIEGARVSATFQSLQSRPVYARQHWKPC